MKDSFVQQKKTKLSSTEKKTEKKKKMCVLFRPETSWFRFFAFFRFGIVFAVVWLLLGLLI